MCHGTGLCAKGVHGVPADLATGIWQAHWATCRVQIRHGGCRHLALEFTGESRCGQASLPLVACGVVFFVSTAEDAASSVTCRVLNKVEIILTCQQPGCTPHICHTGLFNACAYRLCVLRWELVKASAGRASASGRVCVFLPVSISFVVKLLREHGLSWIFLCLLDRVAWVKRISAGCQQTRELS